MRPNEKDSKQGKPCNEYRSMQRRGGRAYSEGHQRMYLGPIALIQSARADKVNILDVGSGIAWGAEQMLRAGIVRNYLGVEPCKESFNHGVKFIESLPEAVKQGATVAWSNKPFLDLPAVWDTPRDYVFCIEVLEHVPEADLPEFLLRLRHFTGRNAFISTPDIRTSSHGTATAEVWEERLTKAGFKVVKFQRHWTTLFICEPVKTEEAVK